MPSNKILNNTAYNELVNSHSTRIKTGFIYAIAAMEEHFGHLWRHDADENETEFTEEEEKLYELYEKFRKSVLDNGNHQIRCMIKDMDKFNVGYRDHNSIKD